MNNELTEVDIKKMQEEIEYRKVELRPKLIEDVKTARAFGDLSENFEYKAAKQEKNKNESRIRYLEQMIRTAKVIPVGTAGDTVGLYDRLELVDEETGDVDVIQLVTTVRHDVDHGFISKESPLGKAVWGRRAGDRVQVNVSADISYFVLIRSVTKGGDDGSLPLRGY